MRLTFLSTTLLLAAALHAEPPTREQVVEAFAQITIDLDRCNEGIELTGRFVADDFLIYDTQTNLIKAKPNGGSGTFRIDNVPAAWRRDLNIERRTGRFLVPTTRDQQTLYIDTARSIRLERIDRDWETEQRLGTPYRSFTDDLDLPHPPLLTSRLGFLWPTIDQMGQADVDTYAELDCKLDAIDRLTDTVARVRLSYRESHSVQGLQERVIFLTRHGERWLPTRIEGYLNGNLQSVEGIAWTPLTLSTGNSVMFPADYTKTAYVSQPKDMYTPGSPHLMLRHWEYHIDRPAAEKPLAKVTPESMVPKMD